MLYIKFMGTSPFSMPFSTKDKYVHEVLVHRLGGLSLPRKSVVNLTDRPDMNLDVYRGRKTTIQQLQRISTMVPSCLAHWRTWPYHNGVYFLTLLHSERPKLYTILAFAECNRFKIVYNFGLSECNKVKDFSHFVTFFSFKTWLLLSWKAEMETAMLFP